MNGTGSGKSSIMKFVPEARMELLEFLTTVGIENIERHTVLVNCVRVTDLHSFVEKDDEIIVLPIIRGG